MLLIKSRWLSSPQAVFITVALAAGMGGAGYAEDAARPIPVQVRKVSQSEQTYDVSLTGSVEARTTSNVGFRISGRITSREVDVGDRVVQGQVIAKLESVEQNADVASAEAAVLAADATFNQSRANLQRQTSLLDKGVSTQALVDNAAEEAQAASAGQSTARANLGIARESLDNTILRAPATGVIVSRNAEAGQVVEAAQTVYTVAHEGARDAVFDVYEALLTRPLDTNTVEIALVSDPKVTVMGTVREVSPVIDETSGTVRVKVRLPENLPAEMTLGAPVTGIGHFDAGRVISVPRAALGRQGGQPVVWVLDEASRQVSAKPIKIASFRTRDVLVAEGLSDGDTVVVSGGQFLRPGATVEPRIEGEKG